MAEWFDCREDTQAFQAAHQHMWLITEGME